MQIYGHLEGNLMEEILHQFRLVFYSTITYDGFLYIPGGSPDFSSINSIAVLGLVSNDLWKNLPNSAQNDAFFTNLDVPGAFLPNGRDGSAVWDQRLGSVGYDPNIPELYVGYNPLGEITY